MIVRTIQAPLLTSMHELAGSEPTVPTPLCTVTPAPGQWELAPGLRPCTSYRVRHPGGCLGSGSPALVANELAYFKLNFPRPN